MNRCKAAFVIAGMALMLGICACEKEGPAEKAGKNIDEAVENAGDAMKKAGESAGEKLEEAGDKVKDATEQ